MIAQNHKIRHENHVMNLELTRVQYITVSATRRCVSPLVSNLLLEIHANTSTHVFRIRFGTGSHMQKSRNRFISEKSLGHICKNKSSRS